MSKITFRADDQLIRRLEAFDASKSEVMRKALRTYLDEHDGADLRSLGPAGTQSLGPIDDLIADRVDHFIADRLDGSFTAGQPRDITVNIELDGETDAIHSVDATAPPATAAHSAKGSEEASADEGADELAGESLQTCSQCGESLDPGHVHCPNCGEKVTHRVYCECGDELQSDWAFCPNCGRRTPAAEVLDNA